MTFPQIAIAVWLTLGLIAQWYYAGSRRRVEITPGGATLTTLINFAIIAWVLSQ